MFAKTAIGEGRQTVSSVTERSEVNTATYCSEGIKNIVVVSTYNCNGDVN